MSRLMQRLRQMDAQADPKRRAERESHQLAGDGLEMAARVALESWQERPRHPDESDVFRLGYRLACHELALVFRAMRKGEPPSKAEFEELRRLVFEDAAGEQPSLCPGETCRSERERLRLEGALVEDAAQEAVGEGVSMPQKIAALNQVIGHTPPAQFIAEHPEAVMDVDPLTGRSYDDDCEVCGESVPWRERWRGLSGREGHRACVESSDGNAGGALADASLKELACAVADAWVRNTRWVEPQLGNALAALEDRTRDWPQRERHPSG